ncbi:MAG: hypothetical protein HYV09_26485 [Deltaproteobacteria bacterium]|nr:hypothetical protein [Deltaproteobacteria bacterium]
MPRTVTIEGDLAELLSRFRAARAARGAAGKALEGPDSDDTAVATYRRARALEDELAMLVALSVSNRAEAA